MQPTFIHKDYEQNGGDSTTTNIQDKIVTRQIRRLSNAKCAHFFGMAMLCAGLLARTAFCSRAAESVPLTDGSSAQPANVVVQWNKTLLVIVRTHGAQPATIHPTRSFALMHAAIFDAVNAIDGKHKPYLIDLSDTSLPGPQDAPAAAAAHEVLVHLYPAVPALLESQ